MSYFGITAEMLGIAPDLFEANIYRPRPDLPRGDKRLISQEFANEIALIAQKYTGYFYGHPTKAGQHGKPDASKVYVEYDKPWDEPIVFPDTCEFCEKTLDDLRVIMRVDGFQAAIDNEVHFGRGKESFPLNDLPLYLKRRLCIEWNHAFKRYIDEHPYLYYDFEAREIKEVIKADERTAIVATPVGLDDFQIAGT